MLNLELIVPRTFGDWKFEFLWSLDLGIWNFVT